MYSLKDKSIGTDVIDMIVFSLAVIVLAVFMQVIFLPMFVHKPIKTSPQTVITIEIYTHYSIEYYNGSVDYVHIDDTFDVACDGWINDDNGHSCVLSHDNSLLFLNAVEYGITPIPQV